ncbi:amidohydrolase [Rhodococcus erythropolis]|uniref:Amidohydrolase n=1 Tax=Rhodococcus erythropolis TaxID=1833 RepID=A0A8I0ZSD9_RHOER|nr:amidohydrolase [Rhodococcus erythropolis]MBH5144730.1 amidohydrolase [Rhodococcus erythropolis]
MEAELLFVGGTIRTGDSARRVSDALAVAGGRVVALGDAARALESARTEVVDLAGGALLPSFGDGHVHPLMAGLEMRGAKIRDCDSIDEVVREVRRWADANPGAECIFGEGVSPTLAPGGLFDAHWLDDVVRDRPVVLRTMDYHTAWVNSAALRSAGLTRDTPDPVGGEIVRTADGELLGTLREWGAINPVLALLPEVTLHDGVDSLAAASKMLAAAGITWVQDAWTELDDVEIWLATAESGRLSTRVNLAFRATPESWKADLPAFVEARQKVAERGGDTVRAETVKFFADGVIEAGTAALLAPYSDCPHSHGISNWTTDELGRVAAEVDRLGFQIHIHAIGDAGVRMALDAIEYVDRCNGPRDRRATIAHLQLVDGDDLDRFESLGVIANFQPLWAQLDPLMTELTIPRIGVDRGELQYRIGSLAERGARVAFGSDWPITAHEPIKGIATAIHRQTSAGVPSEGWLPRERVGLDWALATYSAGIAYQGFEENSWGRLLPGMRADMIQLPVDPRHLASSKELSDLVVSRTWLAGKRVH